MDETPNILKGLALQQAGQLAEAETIYRQILQRQPKNPDALHLLGLIAGQAGRNDVAAELVLQAIAASPGNPDYHCNLGIFLKNQGQTDGAIACYQRALVLKPDHPEALNNLANASREKGDPDNAIANLQRVLALRPDYADAHNNLGMAWMDKGNIDEAIACYQRALTLKADYPDAYNNLGNALGRQRRVDQAIACYQRALAIKPDFAQAHYNLANAWRDTRQIDNAIASYQRALALNPGLHEAHNNLGMAWSDKGEPDHAIACYECALALKPDLLEAFNNLGNAWKDKGELDRAIACYRRALELNPDFIVAHDNLLFTLPYLPASDRRSLFAESRLWNRRHAQPLKRFIRPHSNDRDPNRRLRIGYVSPDFRAQPVGRFLLPLFSGHDRQAFEIYCYSNVIVPDELTGQLRASTDTWRDIVGMPDEQVAGMIRQDRIDILVDLAMHMADNRLPIFARKPAPVQVTYLAYAGGTAVDAIDYRLTDRHLDPDAADDVYYTEKSIRLEGTYWCYQQNIATPPVNELPALATGKITFGCLNNFCKITPATLELWAALLQAIPNSRLLLHAFPGSHRDRISHFLQQRGIAADRLEIVGRMPLEAYFNVYQRVDIALDPIPYCGGTTTCDALWMGVPVVTLAGRTAVGRGGVTILSNAGLPELIARTPDQYIKITAELAGDLPRLAALRSTLRQRMADSTLMDGRRFTRAVERAYRTMWQHWCR